MFFGRPQSQKEKKLSLPTGLETGVVLTSAINVVFILSSLSLSCLHLIFMLSLCCLHVVFIAFIVFIIMSLFVCCFCFLFGPRPLGPWAHGPRPLGPIWARAPGPNLQDTHGESNYLLSGKLPTVRQAKIVRHAPNRSIDLHPTSAYMHPRVSA